MKEESEKAGLKLNIQKTKITASGPITSCQIYEERIETVKDYWENHSFDYMDFGWQSDICAF